MLTIADELFLGKILMLWFVICIVGGLLIEYVGNRYFWYRFIDAETEKRIKEACRIIGKGGFKAKDMIEGFKKIASTGISIKERKDAGTK